MQCKRVKIVGGRFIECESIEPSKELPGFFNVLTDEGELRIINAQAIVEVEGGKPAEEIQLTAEYVHGFYERARGGD